MERGLLEFQLGFLAILLGFSGFASAKNESTQNLDHLAAGETIEGPAFFAGNVVKVDGNVEGTTFISGHDASVGRNLFAAGATILQEGIIQRNLFGDANLQTDSLKPSGWREHNGRPKLLGCSRL